MGDKAAEGKAARGHVFEDYVRYLFRHQGVALLPQQPGQSETDLQFRVDEAADAAVVLPPELAFVQDEARSTVGVGRVLGEVKVSSRKLSDALAQLRTRTRELADADRPVGVAAVLVVCELDRKLDKADMRRALDAARRGAEAEAAGLPPLLVCGVGFNQQTWTQRVIADKDAAEAQAKKEAAAALEREREVAELEEKNAEIVREIDALQQKLKREQAKLAKNQSVIESAKADARTRRCSEAEAKRRVELALTVQRGKHAEDLAAVQEAASRDLQEALERERREAAERLERTREEAERRILASGLGQLDLESNDGSAYPEAESQREDAEPAVAGSVADRLAKVVGSNYRVHGHSQYAHPKELAANDESVQMGFDHVIRFINNPNSVTSDPCEITVLMKNVAMNVSLSGSMEAKRKAFRIGRILLGKFEQCFDEVNLTYIVGESYFTVSEEDGSYLCWCLAGLIHVLALLGYSLHDQSFLKNLVESGLRYSEKGLLILSGTEDVTARHVQVELYLRLLNFSVEHVYEEKMCAERLELCKRCRRNIENIYGVKVEAAVPIASPLLDEGPAAFFRFLSHEISLVSMDEDLGNDGVLCEDSLAELERLFELEVNITDTLSLSCKELEVDCSTIQFRRSLAKGYRTLGLRREDTRFLKKAVEILQAKTYRVDKTWSEEIVATYYVRLALFYIELLCCLSWFFKIEHSALDKTGYLNIQRSLNCGRRYFRCKTTKQRLTLDLSKELACCADRLRQKGDGKGYWEQRAASLFDAVAKELL